MGGRFQPRLPGPADLREFCKITGAAIFLGAAAAVVFLLALVFLNG
jgi:hypothetical protein